MKTMDDALKSTNLISSKAALRFDEVYFYVAACPNTYAPRKFRSILQELAEILLFLFEQPDPCPPCC